MAARTKLVSMIAGAALGAATAPAAAQELIELRRMSLGMAQEVANGAVEACGEKGYQVSATVVDRSGDPQVTLRDTIAPRFTMQIATEKARAVILSGVASSDFRESRADIRQEMNHVDGVMVLGGGLPIRAAGQMVGAVGVSGAPGGDIDAECARAGIDRIQDTLDFAQ